MSSGAPGRQDRDESAGQIVAGFGILLLFGYAFSWVFALLGLLVSSPEAANSLGFIAVSPLTFISSAFVPVASMATASGGAFVDGRSSSWPCSPRWPWRATAGPRGAEGDRQAAIER